MKTGTAIALAVGVPATIGIIAWAVMSNKTADKVITTIPEGTLNKQGFVAPQVVDGEIVIDNFYATYLWALHRASALGFNNESSATDVVRALLRDLGVADDAGILFKQLPPPNDDEVSDVLRAAEGMSWKDAYSKALRGINRKLASLRR